MSDTLYFVGLDVGGTSMKAGVVDDAGRSHSQVSLPTRPERGQEAGLETMCEAIRQAVAAAKLTMDRVTAIGVATPGLMDIKAGLILDPPNLKPWRNVPVRQHVADAFKLPTAYQNDANAAALGEYWVGAGREAHSMVMFTLGTGVGGGIVIGDLVVEGEHSHGGELGHMRVVPRGGRLCGCGRHGCLEQYGSATSVVKRAAEAGVKPAAGGELTSKDVFEQAAAGDAAADGVVEETAFYLALGAVNMMHSIDPDVVAFAGGMTAAGEPFLDRIRKHVKEMALDVPGAKTTIKYAALGSDAGYIGSAACGRMLYYKSKGLPVPA